MKTLLKGMATVALCTGFTTQAAASTSKQICFAASGNGYNWAATLSWMAETIEVETLRMQEGEVRDLNCVAGSSSSGAFIGLVSALRQNPKLFASDAAHRPLTKAEMKTMSKALLFLAFAADMSGDEGLPYTNQDGGLDRGPEWWKGHYQRTKILLDFSSRIAMAYHISKADLALVESFYQLDSVSSIDALFQVMGSHSRNTDFSRHFMWRQLHATAKRIFKRGQKILDRLYTGRGYYRDDRSKALADFTKSADHPVRKVLSLKPVRGHFTLSVVELAYAASPQTYIDTHDNPPSYKNLSTLVMGNAESTRQLFNSKLFQAGVNTSYKHFVFGSSIDLLSQVSISLMEPDLNTAKVFNMTPYSSEDLNVSLSSGVLRYFDPRVHSTDQPKLHRPRTLSTDAYTGRPMLAVTGGWTDGRISSQVLGLFSDGRQQTKRSFYLKTRARLISSFALDKIETYFKGDSKREAKKEFTQRTVQWENLLEELVSKNPATSFEHTTIEWDIPHFPENRGVFRQVLLTVDSLASIGFMKRPAAIKQQSYYQVTHTINGLRVMRGQESTRGLLFDRALKTHPEVYGY